MKILICSFLTLMFAATSAHAAAFFDMEITNIKPAGTGNPAIPATNRIFRAYPGIEYNIRAAVVGGVYPYTYSLSNAPAGMTINSATGEITWTNPQTSASNIQLSVTDSDSEPTTVNTTWSVTVTNSTSDFIFVQSGYSGTESGSITQPYNSLANMLASETSTTKIVYFRNGTYQMVDHNSTADYVMNLDNSPRTWIKYPGATVTLQGGDDTSTKAHRILTNYPIYFDGLNIDDTRYRTLFLPGTQNYTTIRRCFFSGLEPIAGTEPNENEGFMFFADSGAYSVVADNEMTGWVNSSAIGSLYNHNKMLIENNRIYGQRASSVYYGTGTTIGIASKVNNDYMTIRGNSISMSAGVILGGVNSAFYNSDYTEMCFNLFVNTGSASIIWDWEVGFQDRTKYWRNTTIAPIAHRSSTNTGPYTYSNNVIANSGTPLNANHTVTGLISHPNTIALSAIATVTDNLTSTNAALLVDAANNYKLIESQSTYVGSRGWQLADGSTPMDGTFTPPPQGTTKISTGSMRFGAGTTPITVQ